MLFGVCCLLCTAASLPAGAVEVAGAAVVDVRCLLFFMVCWLMADDVCCWLLFDVRCRLLCVVC